MTVKGFSKNLQYFRKQTGLNQEDMSEELGISYSYYTKLESTDEVPSSDVLIRMSEYFNVPMDIFLKDGGYRTITQYADSYMLQELKKLSADQLSLLNETISFFYYKGLDGKTVNESNNNSKND